MQSGSRGEPAAVQQTSRQRVRGAPIKGEPLRWLVARKATALGSGPSGIRVRRAEFTSIRLSFLIELRLKIAALFRESVEIGIVLAPVSISLRLKLILLLLMSRTPTLRMYLGIV